ncbi:hypothetical protein BGZ67_003196 [Mortierella alpina]|nr:hypothetical protein BGZ67_003196 [Mortierella alpina]
MDTEHSNKVPPPLPAKLRWRPYANGSSKKNSKPKKDDACLSQPSAKAMASKVRGKQFYSGKTPSPPVEVKLQWEETETIESMSHGGHPHNQPHSPSQQHHSDSESDSSRSRGPSPGASSVNSSPSSGVNAAVNKSDNGSNSISGNPFSSAMRRAMASLPSPPPSKLLTTRLDLVGGQSDLSQFRASIPELGCNASLQHGLLPLDLLETSSAYQIALSALFQSQSLKTPCHFHTPALIGASRGSMNASSQLNTNNDTAASTLLGSSTIKDALFPEPNGVLSNQDLLDVSTIDELLASCGYVDNTQHAATQMLSSPTNTDQSFTSSPLAELLNFDSSDFMSRGSSPSSSSFSPMAVASTGVEALLAQPVASLPASSSSPMIATTGVSAPAAADPYTVLIQELTSPFEYLSTGPESLVNRASTAWPSLFPTPAEIQDVPMESESATATTTAAPQRIEIATQTDGPYIPPLSPMSAKSASNGSHHGSPQSLFGLSDEELDPDWLSFLDEASPLFNEVDMPSPPPSGDDSTPASSPNVKSTQRDRSMWNWAEELLKPGAQTPTGHRGLPSTAPGMTGMPGSFGNGGLIRTLQGTGQQRVHKPAADSTKPKTEARSPDEGEGTPNEVGTKREQDTKTTAAKAKPDVSPTGVQDRKLQSETKEDGAFGGLMAMLRNLWVGRGGGDNDKS